MELALLTARLVLAGVFIVAGVAKIADRQGSTQAMEDFGVPARFAALLGTLLPVAEIVVAIALIPVTSAWWGALGALALLLAFVGGIGYNLARGNQPDCHCFGQLHSEPAGWFTVARNSALAIVAAFVLWQGGDDGGASTIGWLSDLSTFEQVAIVAGVILFALIAVEGWLLLQVIQQNGRLLFRLDEIDSGTPHSASRTTDRASSGELPVGSPAPSFSLPDVDGNTVALADLLSPGKPLMLFFSSAGCKICGALLPDVARWQREHEALLTVAIISRGDMKKNRSERDEHGLTRVLVQSDREVIQAYGIRRTPTAILIRPDGTIGSTLAAHPDAIRELVKHAISTRSPTANNGRENGTANGNGLLGTPAPDLGLTTLDGDDTRLSSFTNEPATLLFWSPMCGFCNRMLDDLKRLESDRPEGSPRILVISTGDAGRNREQGLRSTVLLDQGFNAGRAFGASGTPSAVRIDAQGLVASQVAVGAPPVLSLLAGTGPAIPAGSSG